MQAVAAVLGMAGTVPTPANTLPPQPPAPAVPSNEQGERLAALWAECRPWLDSRQIVDYLHARGIPLPEKLPVSDDLRFHAALPYWHGAEKRSLGRLAAMVGVFRAVDGTPAGLHITYLVRNRAGQVGKAVLTEPKTGQRLPAKKMRSSHSGSLSGAAIRLFAPENGTLAVCEGIETAIAARYLCGLPVSRVCRLPARYLGGAARPCGPALYAGGRCLGVGHRMGYYRLCPRHRRGGCAGLL